MKGNGGSDKEQNKGQVMHSHRYNSGTPTGDQTLMPRNSMRVNLIRPYEFPHR